MWIGGDPDDITRLAQRLRGLADVLVSDRISVHARLDACRWESAAADSFRRKAADDFHEYDEVVGQVEAAAESLEILARVLAERQRDLMDLAVRLGRVPADLLAEVNTGVGNMLSDAGHLVGSLW